MAYIVAGNAYSLIEAPVPACFWDLEQAVDASQGHFPEKLQHPSYVHGRNLCRRMADVEFYAALIERELAPRVDRNAALVAIAVSSLLVGHCGACKAVLDASAISLATVYRLGSVSPKGLLGNRDMDLGKGRCWVEPLHYHHLWLPQMHDLCAEVCRDLIAFFISNPPPPPPPGYEPL